MELGLLRLSLKTKLLLNLLPSLDLVNLECARHVCFIVVIELVHGIRLSIQNLNVVDVVVPVRFLDLVEETEAVLKLLVKFNVMDSLLHLGNFNIELFLLVVYELIERISTLGQSDLEIHFSQFQLLLVVVHSCCEVFIESDDICADFSHLVNGVIHVVDRVRVQCL